MVDSESQGATVAMTHDSRFILSYLLIALINATGNGILVFYS